MRLCVLMIRISTFFSLCWSSSVPRHQNSASCSQAPATRLRRLTLFCLQVFSLLVRFVYEIRLVVEVNAFLHP